MTPRLPRGESAAGSRRRRGCHTSARQRSKISDAGGRPGEHDASAPTRRAAAKASGQTRRDRRRYGAWLLTAAGDEAIAWDVHAGAPARRWTVASRGTPRTCFVFDVAPAAGALRPGDALAATVACAVSDGTVRVRDVRAPDDAQVLSVPGAAKVTAVGWLRARSEPAVAAACGDGAVRLWDARTWKLGARLRGGHAAAASAAASNSNRVDARGVARLG